MTVAEIIKALECCYSYFDCDGCPCEEMCGGLDDLSKNAIDLINRQKVEIERYKKVVGKLTIRYGGAVTIINGEKTEYIPKKAAEQFKNMAVNRAKSEAIKEFAERLKKKIRCRPWLFPIGISDIDNLVKEMTDASK